MLKSNEVSMRSEDGTSESKFIYHECMKNQTTLIGVTPTMVAVSSWSLRQAKKSGGRTHLRRLRLSPGLSKYWRSRKFLGFQFIFLMHFLLALKIPASINSIANRQYRISNTGKTITDCPPSTKIFGILKIKTF